MSYTRGGNNDQIVILANSANTLMQQYNTQTITLQAYKDSVNTQILPTYNSLDKRTISDDNSMHTVSLAIRMLGLIEE
jgi:hypothetical protein